MKSSDLNRFALRSLAAAAMLAGCGASQPPIGAPGAMPQTSAIATHAERDKSWMLPEAKSEALLYAADFPLRSVHVFAYPKGTSKKYKCDFNRDTGWDKLKEAGFDTVRSIAIDEDWTGLRFRRKEFIKSR